MPPVEIRPEQVWPEDSLEGRPLPGVTAVEQVRKLPPAPVASRPAHRRRRGRRTVTFALVAVLLGTGGAGAWMAGRQVTSAQKAQAQSKAALASTVAQLRSTEVKLAAAYAQAAQANSQAAALQQEVDQKTIKAAAPSPSAQTWACRNAVADSAVVLSASSDFMVASSALLKANQASDWAGMQAAMTRMQADNDSLARSVSAFGTDKATCVGS